ncbi:MAG TPA: FGGY family carbohydrate kinase, partial [Microbacteriaceae bacterium]|nr:FGGY family carbohydrate kinase [Microbacteriaceae bacterium]
MSLGYLVGLDVGTTGAKALVSTAGGQTLAQGHARLDWQATRWGAETAAQAIFDAALEAVRRALRQAPAGPVAAIGIASFAESSVLLGDTGEPVGPVIA